MADAMLAANDAEGKAMSENIEERAAGSVSGWLALFVWLFLFGGSLWQVFGNTLVYQVLKR